MYAFSTQAAHRTKALLVILALVAVMSGVVLVLRGRSGQAAALASSAARAILPATRRCAAAVCGDDAAVRCLPTGTPAQVRAIANSAGHGGLSALHGMLGEEHAQLAALLITSGAHVNVRNDQGVRPLHLAAWPDMPALWCGHAAETDARDHQARTRLHAAIEHPASIAWARGRCG